MLRFSRFVRAISARQHIAGPEQASEKDSSSSPFSDTQLTTAEDGSGCVDDGSETENAEGGGDGSESNQLLNEGAVQSIARQILQMLGSANPAAGGDSSSSSSATNTHTALIAEMRLITSVYDNKTARA